MGLRIYCCTEFGKLNYGNENPHGRTNNASITNAVKPRLETQMRSRAPGNLSLSEDEFQPFNQEQERVYSETSEFCVTGTDMAFWTVYPQRIQKCYIDSS